MRQCENGWRTECNNSRHEEQICLMHEDRTGGDGRTDDRARAARRPSVKLSPQNFSRGLIQNITKSVVQEMVWVKQFLMLHRPSIPDRVIRVHVDLQCQTQDQVAEEERNRNEDSLLHEAILIRIPAMSSREGHTECPYSSGSSNLGTGSMRWRTTTPVTRKIRSSAMFVVRSAIRSR